VILWLRQLELDDVRRSFWLYSGHGSACWRTYMKGSKRRSSCRARVQRLGRSAAWKSVAGNEIQPEVSDDGNRDSQEP
jgi:hypothetical protein